MATIIWCDRVRHIVEDSRSDIARGIASVKDYRGQSLDAAGNIIEATHVEDPLGFLYVTPVNSETQRALNVHLISSFEAVAGDGI